MQFLKYVSDTNGDLYALKFLCDYFLSLLIIGILFFITSIVPGIQWFYRIIINFYNQPKQKSLTTAIYLFAVIGLIFIVFLLVVEKWILISLVVLFFIALSIIGCINGIKCLIRKYDLTLIIIYALIYFVAMILITCLITYLIRDNLIDSVIRYFNNQSTLKAC